METNHSDEQFAVLRFAAEWRVLRNGRDSGHFDYQVDAVETAIRLADTARREGRTVEVLVQDKCGQIDRLDPA